MAEGGEEFSKLDIKLGNLAEGPIIIVVDPYSMIHSSCWRERDFEGAPLS